MMDTQQTLPDVLATDDWPRCANAFLRSLFDRSGSQKTVQAYRYILRDFFVDSPPKRPEDYTREDVENFIHHPTTAKRNHGDAPSVATINQRLSVISAFYKFAATFTITGSDGHPTPLMRTYGPTLGIRRGQPARSLSNRTLSLEDMYRFFAVIPDTIQGLRDRAVFLMYFWTARRREEIARLRYGDIEEGMIVEEGGKRRKGWHYRFTGKGKSGQVDQAELPLPAKVAIDRYLKASGRLITIKAEDPLFVAHGPGPHCKGRRQFDGHKPLTSRAIAHNMKVYATAAGLDSTQLSIHSWRHTAAHERYSAGEDVRSLQQLLRHSNIATTDIYIRGLMGTADPGASLIMERFAYLSDH